MSLYEDDDVPADETCNDCGGPLVVLGTLGSVTHFRCRDCGGDSHQEAR